MRKQKEADGTSEIFANERVCIVCQGDPRKILGPAHDCVPPGREETELASP